MKKIIIEYFTFSRSQKRGIVILIILIIITLLAPKVYFYYNQKKTKPDLSFFDKVIVNEPTPVLINKQVSADSLFSFDPNKTTFSDLIKLGFEEKTAHIIIKYRNEGGKFKQPSDLSKIYGINDSLYKKVLPFIEIENLQPESKFETINKMEEKEKWEDSGKTYQHENTIEIFELNTIDSLQLVSLPGIGPAIAKRVLNYRNYLGGFYKVEQLKEVYNMPPETYEKLQSRFSADTSLITKINLNIDDLSKLNKHPYLSYTQIRSLISFKKTMGQFKSPNDLLKYHLVDSVSFDRLRPYLVLN